MKYLIGDVSDILGLSPEMIRYYERQGLIRPERNRENNYRCYSIQDLFILMEVLQFKDLDINIKDFIYMKSNGYTDRFSEHLMSYREKLKEEIMRKEQLRFRVDELIRRIESCKYNIGKYWVKKRHACYQLPLLESENDEYHVMRYDKETLRLFTDDCYSFFDNEVEFLEDGEKWYNSVDEAYLPAVKVAREALQPREEYLCLCTVVDMGDMGAFSRECLSGLLDYANENRIEMTGNIRGILCSRGMESERYQRFLELQMPIRP